MPEGKTTSVAPPEDGAVDTKAVAPNTQRLKHIKPTLTGGNLTETKVSNAKRNPLKNS